MIVAFETLQVVLNLNIKYEIINQMKTKGNN